MKKMKLIMLTVISIVNFGLTAYAHGDMKVMYNTYGEMQCYIVVQEEQVPFYSLYGWTQTTPEYDALTDTVMYSDDGRVQVFPNKYAEAQHGVGWHYVPRKIMYSADNRTIAINADEIPIYENVCWFIEPVAVMRYGNTYEYVLSSEIEQYRRNGWFATDYCAQLYELGTQIKQYIANKSGRYGIYIKNLKTNEYLILNDNQYASASIIKLFVAAGIYNEMACGSVANNSTVRSYLKSMISVSDNYSSNFLVKTMGHGSYYDGFNTENAHNWSIGCINTQHKSLFIGCGDYVSYGKNLVSPLDCGILLEKIYYGTLVSPDYSYEFFKLLRNQQRRSKIPYYLPSGVICANKTGETSTVESDVGIVFSPQCDYIICVLTNNAPAGVNVIRQISRMTYNYFNQ